MKVEIWDSDPTSDCCCGPGMISQQSVQRIMNSINEKNEIIKMLRDELKDVRFRSRYSESSARMGLGH